MTDVLNIALLHLAPIPGDIARNAEIAAHGIALAAERGASWVVTPELCLTGYDFIPYIGTDWILPPEKDFWLLKFRDLAARHGVTLFFAHPERDAQSGKLYNALFVIGTDGTVLGRHRKINTLQGAESWSTRGSEVSPVLVNSIRTGLLVCADAYFEKPAHSLADAGVDVIISSANWAPKPHGPEGCWERRSRELGKPLFVCNRTGMDRELDFSPSETVLAYDGQRLLTHRSRRTMLVFLEWSSRQQRLLRQSLYVLNNLAAARA